MLYQYLLPIEANKYDQMIANLSNKVSSKFLEITSPAFNQNAFIPEQYTCDGKNEAPVLIANSIPVGTWVHWIAWNIRPNSIIMPNKIRCRQGMNDFGMHKYCGPCPPNGMHHYHFKVYALDCYLMDLNTNCTKYQLEKAMATHILAFGELIGLYKRH